MWGHGRGGEHIFPFESRVGTLACVFGGSGNFTHDEEAHKQGLCGVGGCFYVNLSCLPFNKSFVDVETHRGD
jgi:hypothetical protein